MSWLGVGDLVVSVKTYHLMDGSVYLFLSSHFHCSFSFISVVLMYPYFVGCKDQCIQAVPLSQCRPQS